MSTPTQKSAAVTFTAEEARVLLQLVDAAVKSIGLTAAESAAFLAKKINVAFQEAPKENVVL